MKRHFLFLILYVMPFVSMCVAGGAVGTQEATVLTSKLECLPEETMSKEEWEKIENGFDPAKNIADRNFEVALEQQENVKDQREVKKVRISTNTPSVEILALYDVGSSGVKVEVVEVDLKTGKYSILYWDRKNTSFAITPGKDYEERLEAMKYFEKLIEKNFGPVVTGREENGKGIKEIGIATSGFRNAGDLGVRLAQDINLQTNINFNIIPQDYEGALMFMAVRNGVRNFDEHHDLVWDIGGGSFQITGMDEQGDYEYWGTRIASRTLKDYLLKRFKKVPESELTKATLNPISEKQIFEMECATGWLLGKFWSRKYRGWQKEDYEGIKKKLEKHGKVYGVGAVHNYVVLRLVNAVLKKSQNFYTINDVQEVLNGLANKTDEEISQIANEKEMLFVRNFLISLMLVHTIMDKLGIARVDVVDVDNTDGLVAREVLSYRGLAKPVRMQ